MDWHSSYNWRVGSSNPGTGWRAPEQSTQILLLPEHRQVLPTDPVLGLSVKDGLNAGLKFQIHQFVHGNISVSFLSCVPDVGMSEVWALYSDHKFFFQLRSDVQAPPPF